MHELCMAHRAGKVRRAASIHLRLLALHRQLFCEASPRTHQWAMQQLGLCGPGCACRSCRSPRPGRPGAGRCPATWPALRPELAPSAPPSSMSASRTGHGALETS